ncbi:MAG: hypothetical protein Q4G68_08970 [Planctomycetia bacterium]|nr:hypothetical protein [Planctomycetia bacterium]
MTDMRLLSLPLLARRPRIEGCERWTEVDLTRKKARTLRMGVVLFFLVLLFGGPVWGEDDFSLIIKPDAEVGALLESQEYAQAEILAREKQLDTRVIAVIMVFAGKNDEAIATFLDYLATVPEDKRAEFAMQAVHLAANASEEVSEKLLRELIARGLLNADSPEVKCHEIMALTGPTALHNANAQVTELLAQSQTIPRCVREAALTLVARLNAAGEAEKANALVQTLYAKAPNDPEISIQKIASLVHSEPQQALAELDKLKRNMPDLYRDREAFLEFLNGKALETLGEDEAAKTIYQKLLTTAPQMEVALKTSLKAVNRRLDRAARVAEKGEDQTQPLEVRPHAFRRSVFLILVNTVLVAIILFRVYRRKQSAGQENVPR